MYLSASTRIFEYHQIYKSLPLLEGVSMLESIVEDGIVKVNDRSFDFAILVLQIAIDIVLEFHHQYPLQD